MSASLPLSASERRLRNLSVSGLLLAVAITGVVLYVGWWKPWSAAHARTEQLAQRQSRAQTLLATADDTHAALMQAEGLARQQRTCGAARFVQQHQRQQAFRLCRFAFFLICSSFSVPVDAA